MPCNLMLQQMLSSKNTIFKVLLADNDAIVCVKSAMINENGRSATQWCCYCVETSLPYWSFSSAAQLMWEEGTTLEELILMLSLLMTARSYITISIILIFYFPLYWFWLQVMVNNIIATAGLIEVIDWNYFGQELGLSWKIKTPYNVYKSNLSL